MPISALFIYLEKSLHYWCIYFEPKRKSVQLIYLFFPSWLISQIMWIVTLLISYIKTWVLALPTRLESEPWIANICSTVWSTGETGDIPGHEWECNRQCCHISICKKIFRIRFLMSSGHLFFIKTKKIVGAAQFFVLAKQHGKNLYSILSNVFCLK